MRPTRFRLIALLAVVILNISVAACSALDSAGSVTVLGPWTGEEEKNFKQVLDTFEKRTNIQVLYRGTRALNEDLLSDVQQGTQPDVAILGGELAQYQRRDAVRSLDDVIELKPGAYSDQWLALQNLGTENLYGVVIKANLKSIIWFNPNQFPNPNPGTWDEFVALSQRVAGPAGTPWCLGMGDTPSSGWPGTDWIEDILLRKFGIETYREWVSGKLSWTSSEVRQSWMDWGTIMAGSGHRSALLTDFGDAGRPLFADPPGCFLHHQPSFIMGFYQGYKDGTGVTQRPGADFDFFPFPEFGTASSDPASKAYVVSADLAAMLNDTEQARKLIQYLATEEAQRIWPAIPGGGAFSVNKNVELDVYGDPVSRRIAEIVTSANTLCYDAADLMPVTVRNAFNRAVLEYLSNPDQLDSLLEQLDQVRQGVPPEEKANFLPC